MNKSLFLMALAPAACVLAQNAPATQLPGQTGPTTTAPQYPAGAPHAAPTGAPQYPAGAPQAAPTGAPHFPAGAPHAAPTGAPHFPAGAPHVAPTGAPHHPTGAPQQVPNGQPGPGAYIPGHDSPDHDEIVGTVIGIDEANQLVRVMTKGGPVALKVTEDSELLLPGDKPEALLEIDPEEFKRESKGKMVRIASRNGKIDHIEPAN